MKLVRIGCNDQEGIGLACCQIDNYQSILLVV